MRDLVPCHKCGHGIIKHFANDDVVFNDYCLVEGCDCTDWTANGG